MLLHFPDLLVFYINIIHLVPSYYNLCFPSFLWQSEIWRIRRKKRDYLNLSLKQRVLVWLFEKRQEFVNSVGGKSTKPVSDFLFVYVYDNRFCI